MKLPFRKYEVAFISETLVDEGYSIIHVTKAVTTGKIWVSAAWDSFIQIKKGKTLAMLWSENKGILHDAYFLEKQTKYLYFGNSTDTLFYQIHLQEHQRGWGLGGGRRGI